MMEIVIPLLIIAALILLNGLFVAAEFAIIGAPRSAIEQRAGRGEPAACRVRKILRDPRKQDRYLATAQLGITFASLGLGMYGEHVLARWFSGWFQFLGAGQWVAAHGLASALAVLVLTYFHIVVGEMVPKSLALSYAEKTVLHITGPMLLIKRIFYPLVLLLNGMGNGILTLMGIRRELAAAHYYTPEELEMVIGESEKGGLLHAESGRVLRELFDFGDLTAGQVAVPRVRTTAIRAGASPDTLAETLQQALHARYPVYERDPDQIIGYVHVKDILRLLMEGHALSAEEVRPVAFVPETLDLEDVLEAIHEAGSQLAVVMDEQGGTAGVITIEDLCAEVLGETEEIGGKTLQWSREDDGRLRVAGTLRLEELGELLARDLLHGDVETVSGLVLHLLGRVPRAGDTVTWHGVRFEVASMIGRGVGECVIVPGESVVD